MREQKQLSDWKKNTTDSIAVLVIAIMLATLASITTANMRFAIIAVEGD